MLVSLAENGNEVNPLHATVVRVGLFPTNFLIARFIFGVSFAESRANPGTTSLAEAPTTTPVLSGVGVGVGAVFGLAVANGEKLLVTPHVWVAV